MKNIKVFLSENFQFLEMKFSIYCNFVLCFRNGFALYRLWQHSFVKIHREIYSMIILSLLLIQKEQWSVSGKRMCTSTG